MRRFVTFFIAFCLIVGALPAPQATFAATEAPAIVDVQGNTILLSDGSIWIKRLWTSSGYEYINIDAVEIQDTGNGGYALNSKGELISWEYQTLPVLDKKQTGIKELFYGYYLKKDGTVWDYSGNKRKDVKEALLVDYYNGDFAYLSEDGEIYHSNWDNLNKVVETIKDPSSIVSLKVSGDDSMAYLDKAGKVMMYSSSWFDYDNGVFTHYPKLLLEDVVHMEFIDKDHLLATKKNGTVWLVTVWDQKATQLKAIKNAAKAMPYHFSGGLDDPKRSDNDRFITFNADIVVQQKDGNWKFYDGDQSVSFNAPQVTDIAFTTNNAKPAVGNLVYFKVVQNYNNGYKETLDRAAAPLMVDKPHLLQPMNDGSYKVLGVGEAKVTVTAGGISKSLVISSSLGKNLTGALHANSIIYLPIQTVFKSLGGVVTYTAANKTYDIKLGSTTIQLKVGQKTAKVNGKDVGLGQAVREEKGVALFPSVLLSNSLGAKNQWDAQLKQMKVSIGSATMIIESADTPKIKKQEAQGSLANYIGKVYWVNQYNNWGRFIKLTVSDVVPLGNDNFEIVFQKVDGGQLKTETIHKTVIPNVLGDSSKFLTYDPYKKFNWSAATWEKIKASKVAIGMNKAQVELSWGLPHDKSSVVEKNITIEVWRYGYQYIAFTNGTVSGIYSY
ncbi:copper amine oxidase N-terminal domain-containing protein [Paenibacillus sp. PAMC21692]|uniref:copper amine oxidase N-terminal domain-containing protein n=1 Tax=Paenibacillus sp. PAMC21692 TaxID=2762320 RepID=UPI00164E8EBA|nr:copper amine oxidase N-terminal domain-containing protein [Paenibacillus sp. PAMC21692]QNK58710.1 copper amine oxidase N-terminal domain-containing protein [Paenibacillus sp. PAMC21692]